VKATTVTPVTEPDVTLTMTMLEARQLRSVLGEIGREALRRLLPDADGASIADLDDTIYDTYMALASVAGFSK